MANEIQVRVGLTIHKTSSGVTQVKHRSEPTGFNLAMTGAFGPTPGAVTALHTGTIVDLSKLVEPGVCWIKALFDDEDDYVEYGMYDPATDVFYPWGELGPGEAYPVKLSRNLLESYEGTGTGTTGPIKYVMVKAFTGPCNISFEAFER